MKGLVTLSRVPAYCSAFPHCRVATCTFPINHELLP